MTNVKIRWMYNCGHFYGIIRALNRIIVGIFIYVINDTIRQHNSIISYDIISALN